MKIKIVDTEDGGLVVQLSGDMDALGCSEIRSELQAISDQSPAHTVLDINRVDFIDSSGIGAIVFLFKRLKEQERTMEIINVQGQPQELMTLLRINSAIPLSFADASQVEQEG